MADRVSKAELTMLIEMVDEEFRSIVNQLSRRQDSVREEITELVQKDVGIDNLWKELDAKRHDTKKVMQKIANMTGESVSFHSMTVYASMEKERCRIPRLVAAKMKSINVQLTGTIAARRQAVKDLRIAHLSENAKNLMLSIAADCSERMKEIEKLPPVDQLVKQLTAPKKKAKR